MRQYHEVRCQLCAIVVGSQSACMAARKKLYSLDLKRRVVSSLNLNDGNVSAAAKMHGVHRKLVQSWRKQHDELEKLAAGRDTAGRKRRRLLRTPKDGSSASFPEMEVRLIEWIRSCREDDHVLLDGASVKKHALKLYEDTYLEEPGDTFLASNGWLHRFMKRHRLFTRTVTTEVQKIPADTADKAREFIKSCRTVIDEEHLPLSSIANMDETPMWFDMPSKRTIDFRGVKTVPSKTTGKQKLRYTVVLCAMANGTKLPPIIIFKGLKKIPRGPFPKDIVVTVAKGGSMTSDLLKFWMTEVWRKRPNSLFRAPACLVYDRHASHMNKTVLSALKRHH